MTTTPAHWTYGGCVPPTTEKNMGSKPFLKWAGGKYRSMKKLLPVLSTPDFEGYFEPFLGSGSAFLGLSSADRLNGGALLSDSNLRLIEAWQQVQDHPKKVISWLKILETEDSQELFIDLRETLNEGPEKFRGTPGFYAAVFIYLNRACYNGLYRENSSGGFNTSFAGPQHRDLGTNICFEERILRVSDALSLAVICPGDFETMIGYAGPRDLIYVDSPYHKTSKVYTAGAFTEDDQVRLAFALLDAVQRGAYFVASNSDTPFIRSLYRDFCLFNSSRVNAINHNAQDRSAKPDLVITSFN